jgi:hypothetical protein
MSSNSDIDRIVNERLEEVAAQIEALLGIRAAACIVRAAKTPEVVVYGPEQTVRSKATGSICHLGRGGYLKRGWWFEGDLEFTSADFDLVEIPGADS